MADETNKLGTSSIEVRADLSKLPGDLAAAREMVDKATAKPVDATAKPNQTAPDATAKPVDASSVKPAIDEVEKVPEKVGPAVDTWDKYTESVKKTEEPGRAFVQSIQAQVRVLTAFIGTFAAVTATIYAATRAGIKFGEQLFINQFDAARFTHEMERSTKSIEDFNAQREKSTERRFGPDLGGFGVTAVGKKLTQAVEADELAKKQLREFQESGIRQLGSFVDTALISVGIPPQFGQAVKEEELKYEAQMTANRRAPLEKQFEEMSRGRSPRPSSQGAMDGTDVVAENTGETVKILKMMDASRPR
jgi:hypothetical protein